MQLETEVKRLVDFSLCALVSRYKYIHLILFSFQNWIQRDPVMSRKSIACIPYKMHTIERTSAVFANEDRLKILPLNRAVEQSFAFSSEVFEATTVSEYLSIYNLWIYIFLVLVNLAESTNDFYRFQRLQLIAMLFTAI